MAQIQAARGARVRRRERVLFVDDDPAVLAALGRLLEREPYEILATDRPAEALAWVGAGGVDLVVSDQRMPEMAGTDLLAEIGRRSPGTVRLILTAYPESTCAEPELWRKTEGVMGKPWDGAALRREIRRMLRARRLGPADDTADLGD